MKKLDWDKFSIMFNESWHSKLKPFIESKDCWDIYQELKTRKSTTFPESFNLWKAFQYVNYSAIKAIIIGQCPYHTHERGNPVADGLAFSCGNTKKESPSLKVIFDAIEDNLKRKIDRNPDLTYLAFQDVLLLNTSLTVKKGIADSDNLLWQPFIDYLFKNVLDVHTSVPIIIFGEVAKEQIVPLLTKDHTYMCIKHPSFYARREIPMEHNNVFTWANKILKDLNNEEIYWDYSDYIEKGLPF